ncbi:hypothetical protein D3273_03765 [Lichenibacterium minor]|uniref:Uncharacterized protein n=1 Tax=Lichenibacterium minor TaxID=2316528 RepID=A0A4Q2U9S4_9HYPH|nr:hypothetical protein [Lichenibacterium minor]RYC33589.1 hypothetical protein D3273_03765 [Lichenibacterium minor]
MARYVHGSAPGVAVGPVDGTRAVLHRYEVVGDALVRRRIADRRPFVDGEVRLIDVLINEDEAGRSINMVRGILVNERDLARRDPPAGPTAWREFAVGADMLLAIGEDLRIGPRGRPALRLATRDGLRVG